MSANWQKRNSGKPEFANSPRREINIRLAKMVTESKLTWAELAFRLGAELGGEITPESLKRHFLKDSGSAYTIAKLCKFFGLKFAEPDDIHDGQIIAKLQKEMTDRDWTVPMLARRMWPRIKKEDYPRFVGRLYKFFNNDSRDAYMIARMLEVYGYPTVSSQDFLNEDERREMVEAAQLELAI